MALNPAKRENLLRDATQFARRVRFVLPAANRFGNALWLEPADWMGLTEGAGLMQGLGPAPGVGLAEEGAQPGLPQPDIPGEIFVGIRESGGWSVYFGEDPVLQFNAGGELRRLYLAGCKLAASEEHLLVLNRKRSGGRVELVESRLERETERKLILVCRDYLERMWHHLRNNEFQWVEMVPADDPELRPAVTSLFENVCIHFRVAADRSV